MRFNLLGLPDFDGALVVGEELLWEHTDVTVIGDKAYVSATVQAELRALRRICLLSLLRRNQKAQVPDAVRRALNSARQIIETVNDQFNVERNHAHSFWGCVPACISS